MNLQPGDPDPMLLASFKTSLKKRKQWLVAFGQMKKKKLTGLPSDFELDPTVTRPTELEEVGGVVILKDESRLNVIDPLTKTK